MYVYVLVMGASFQRSRDHSKDISQIQLQSNFSDKSTRKWNNKYISGFVYLFIHLKICIFRCHGSKGAHPPPWNLLFMQK